MACPSPRAASAVIPFPVVASPAPTSPNSAARSSTVTRHPACASATADASPAIPPPTTVAVSPSASMNPPLSPARRECPNPTTPCSNCLVLVSHADPACPSWPGEAAAITPDLQRQPDHGDRRNNLQKSKSPYIRI